MANKQADGYYMCVCVYAIEIYANCGRNEFEFRSVYANQANLYTAFMVCWMASGFFFNIWVFGCGL